MNRGLLAIGLGCVALLAAACTSGSEQSGAPPLRIAAASDLALAMPELVDLYRQRHGREVSVTLGSSGLLARQVAQGAPFDLLLSANVAFVDDLIANGHAPADSRRIYARGRVVVWTRDGAIAPVEDISDLADTRFRRIALANPEHAPYGLAGKEALDDAGLWEAVESRVVYAENIAQTLQLVRSGNADAGIVALALALHTSGGSWLLIDEDLHAPIDQGLVVTRQAVEPEEARAFSELVMSPEGRAIMRRHGFVLPGETLDLAHVEAAR